MKEMVGPVQYLGLLASWGSSKKKSLGHLWDKMSRKVQGWSNEQLNQVGKEVLIKSAIQPIPINTFMVSKVHSSVFVCLISITSNFWWGKGQNGGMIHWGA